MTMVTNPFTIGFWLWLAFQTGSTLLGVSAPAPASLDNLSIEWLLSYGGPDHAGHGLVRLGVGGVGLCAGESRVVGARGVDSQTKAAGHVLRTEQKVHHIAVFHHVLLAFGAHLAGVFGTLLAFVGDEVVKRNGLGADIALLKVGVDHAGGLWAGVADADGPGAAPLSRLP
jgi:hypothetical protein